MIWYDDWCLNLQTMKGTQTTGRATITEMKTVVSSINSNDIAADTDTMNE
jgi:hypothetical protein